VNKVCVFIDGSSLYFGLKRNNRTTRVDYYEFSKTIVGPDRHLVKTHYYNSAYDPSLSPEQYKTQQPFLNSLSMTPNLELHLGRLVPTREGRFKEIGADVKFASEIVYFSAKNTFDTAIVITENTDLVSALSQVKELGVHLELGLFRDSQQKDLLRVADRTISLDDVFERISPKLIPIVKEKPDEKLPNVEPVKRKPGRPRNVLIDTVNG
jgi:uncharacterized LabA/DUF88 family protein